MNERFNESACKFFQEVYFHFFKILSASKKNINVELFKKFNSIKILDSSSWKISKALKDIFPGYNQAGCKIQLMLDYITGTLCWFDLTKETFNDQGYSKTIGQTIIANDLFIFDLAYVVAETIVTIHSKTAFFSQDSIQKVFVFTQKKKMNFIKLISCKL